VAACFKGGLTLQDNPFFIGFMIKKNKASLRIPTHMLWAFYLYIMIH